MPASRKAGGNTAIAASSRTAGAAPPRRISPPQRTSGSVTAVPIPARTRAGASRARGSNLSASRPPSQVPYAMAPSDTPITELLTCSVIPTYGPTSRNATISRTSTAPLAKKTRAVARRDGSGRGSIRQSEHGQMHVVGVDRRRPARRAVRPPAGAGHPDLPEPDHVHDAEAVGVLDEVRGQVVAVDLVAAARRHVLEPGLVGGEVAGPALGMLAGGALAEAGGVMREPGRPRLLVRVQQSRRDAPGRGGVVDRAGLLGPGAVRVARRGLGQRGAGADEAARHRSPTGRGQRGLGLPAARGEHDDLLPLLVDLQVDVRLGPIRHVEVLAVAGERLGVELGHRVEA